MALEVVLAVSVAQTFLVVLGARAIFVVQCLAVAVFILLAVFS